MKEEIRLSPEFKTQTTKAIVSILFFALVYLFIFSFTVVLTVLCVLGGIMLIWAIPRFITIVLGIGLASLGILILIFVLKFIFKSHKVDRSHLLEVNEEDQPDLFRFIREIVEEVGTSFPKKVYLSSDVNAGVFYDSSFWSMFFPVKKNLQIGMGLINTITETELKAILAHEFGHFSQKTMKVGSYVYNVNQVIFNMLYDNESYERLIQGWAGISGYFSVFVIIAVKIIQGIQWVLQKMYGVVNKNYLGLSREMEFHADEIAVHVTGYEPLKDSLLRMSVADNSFNSVLDFYGKRIEDNVKSRNLYQDHTFLMNFIAKINRIPVVDSFPQVTLEEVNKYNKSKLVIADQWASHPTTKERIKRMESLGLTSAKIDFSSAKNIFRDIEKLQEKLTEKVFEQVTYQNDPIFLSVNDFEEAYQKEFTDDSFPEQYNGYYDSKNPIAFNTGDILPEKENSTTIEELFSDKNVELVYTEIALKKDIDVLEQIATTVTSVKTFDYDGKKYKRKESRKLIAGLQIESEQVNDRIKENDIAIYRFFLSEECKHNKEEKLCKLYESFFSFDKEYDSMYGLYVELRDALQFINVTTPFKQIEINFRNIEPLEKRFKDEIRNMLSDSIYDTEMTEQMRENFETYLPGQLTYFKNETYFDHNLQTLFTALNDYTSLLSKKYFLLKKNLLNYQVDLLRQDKS